MDYQCFLKKCPSVPPLLMLEKALTAVFTKDDGSVCFLQTQVLGNVWLE